MKVYECTSRTLEGMRESESMGETLLGLYLEAINAQHEKVLSQ